MPRTSQFRFEFRPKQIAVSVAVCFALNAPLVSANPTGGTVASGAAGIATAGNTLTVTNSANAIINWQGFSIGINEITRFQQPSAASAVLNRVVGSGGVIPQSVIDGVLSSNGRVFLLNPMGIVIGASARIDVAGLVASSLNLSDQDFLNGTLRFTEVPGAGAVVNHGVIETTSGGRVFLVAPQVENSGIIRAPQGEIVLAAGKSADLVSESSPYVTVRVVADTEQALNVGSLIAESGRIGMYGALLRNSGVAEANGASVGPGGQIRFLATKDLTLDAGSRVTANGTSGGQVILQADGGTNLIAGTIEATGSSGKGGTVQALGVRVGVIGHGVIDASGETGGGTVLVGGDFQGKNPAVQNAERTLIGPDGVIRADARTTGDGGRVIVWADGDTRFYGKISARGGSQAGDGGFVETSGKHALDFRGMVDTRAPMGRAGTLLLDPDEITIRNNSDEGPNINILCNGGACPGAGGPFTDTAYGGPGTLTDGTINTQLGMGSVEVLTSSGRIVVASNGVFITPNGGLNSNTLTLNSATDVRWNGGWTYANNGALTLRANNGGISGSGRLTAGNLILSALNGIGVDSPIQTQVNNLQASNGNTQYGIEISNLGTLNLADLGAGYAVRNIGGGLNISTTGGGNLNVNGAVMAGRRFSLRSDGNLALNADVTANTKNGTPPNSELYAPNGSITGSGSVFTNGTALEVSAAGSVTMGSISTAGGPGTQSTWVEITSNNGSIQTGSITTGSTTNNYSYVLIEANGGGVTTGGISTGSSQYDSSVEIYTGNNGGNILVNGSISTGSGSRQSLVELNADLGVTVNGTITTGGARNETKVELRGNNGPVTVTGNIQTGSTDGSEGGHTYVDIYAGAGDAVIGGSITTGNALALGCCNDPANSSVSVEAQSGSIRIGGPITTGNATNNSSTEDADSRVFLTATSGSVSVNGPIKTGAADGGEGFTSVIVNAGSGIRIAGSITTGDAITHLSCCGPEAESKVELTTDTGGIAVDGGITTGNALVLFPDLNSHSDSSVYGRAGSGDIQFAGPIKTGQSPGFPYYGGAPVTLVTGAGSVRVLGVIDTHGADGVAGIDNGNGGNGGSLTIRATDSVVIGPPATPGITRVVVNTSGGNGVGALAYGGHAGSILVDPEHITINGIIQALGGTGGAGGGNGGNLDLLTLNKVGTVTFINGGWDLTGAAGLLSDGKVTIEGTLIFITLLTDALTNPDVAQAVGQTIKKTFGSCKAS